MNKALLKRVTKSLEAISENGTKESLSKKEVGDFITLIQTFPIPDTLEMELPVAALRESRTKESMAINMRQNMLNSGTTSNASSSIICPHCEVALQMNFSIKEISTSPRVITTPVETESMLDIDTDTLTQKGGLGGLLGGLFGGMDNKESPVRFNDDSIELKTEDVLEALRRRIKQ